MSSMFLIGDYKIDATKGELLRAVSVHKNGKMLYEYGRKFLRDDKKGQVEYVKELIRDFTEKEQSEKDKR